MRKATIIAFLLGGILGVGGGGAAGFAFGIYYLPIWVEEEGASETQVSVATKAAAYKANFKRDLKGSDGFHWGEGTLYLTQESDGQYYFTLDGQVAPGPDYKLYLVPKMVETEAEFFKIKAASLRVADIKSFTNFRVGLPQGANPMAFGAVVIWCEKFRQFITAGKLERN